MKYHQPFGVSDPDAAWVDGNPQTGTQGSIPPAASIEFPQRELVNLINSSNFTPNDADLYQLTKATRSQAINFAQDTGTQNACVVALVPALTAYTPGLPLRIRMLNANQNNTNFPIVTLDAGAGPQTIKRMDGTNPATNDLPAGGVFEVTWDGTYWQLTNFGGGGGASPTVNFYNIPYCVDSSATPNLITAPFNPAITSLSAGFLGLIKVANNVTGATTLTINALTTYPVKAPDGSDLLPGDITAGDVVNFTFDGSNFYIRPNPAISVNTTFNVPTSRFPSVASVFAALTRKSIAPTATVTIQLANGIYTPITIYHQNADQIVIKGTMLAAAPVYANFAGTGNTDAKRAADSATNIVMLRASYGTEIQVTQATIGANRQGVASGVTNLGPGKPLIQDILITGDNVPVWDPTQLLNIGSWLLVGIDAYGTQVRCNNISTWGLTTGFLANHGGFIDLTGVCNSVSCWLNGFSAERGSKILANKGLISLSHYTGGVAASAGSQIIITPPTGDGSVIATQVRLNRIAGVSANHSSTIEFYGAISLGNQSWDLFANTNGNIVANGSTFTNFNPAPINTFGNIGAFISFGGPYPPGSMI